MFEQCDCFTRAIFQVPPTPTQVQCGMRNLSKPSTVGGKLLGWFKDCEASSLGQRSFFYPLQCELIQFDEIACVGSSHMWSLY